MTEEHSIPSPSADGGNGSAPKSGRVKEPHARKQGRPESHERPPDWSRRRFLGGAVAGLGDSRLQAIAIASAALFSIALAVFYWLTLREARAYRVADLILDRLPATAGARLRPHVRSLVGALRSVHDWRSFLLVAFFSILGWTVEAGAYAIVGLAFDLKVGFAHYVLLLAAVNLAIIIPTFFGGTGPFEWAAKLVLVNAGIAGGLAAAYAIVALAVVVAPATVVGLILLWTFGIPIARLGRIGAIPVEERNPVNPVTP